MERVAVQIADWMRAYAASAGAYGFVVGLSGGVDSACTAALAQRAMGSAVLGVVMPCHSDRLDSEFAEMVAIALGLETVHVDLSPVFDQMQQVLSLAKTEAGGSGERSMAQANIKPRLRMLTLYYYAAERGYLVAGTGNKSEIMIGYFTKYGDGGVDLEPLGDLYKGQVRALAAVLGVPTAVIDRAPSAGLWPGQTDEGEMGIRYDQLDAALAAIESGYKGSVPPDLLARVQDMIDGSEHKRRVPPICRLGLR